MKTEIEKVIEDFAKELESCIVKKVEIEDVVENLTKKVKDLTRKINTISEKLIEFATRKRCELCGKLVEKNQHKYCKSCAGKKKEENAKKWFRQNRRGKQNNNCILCGADISKTRKYKYCKECMEKVLKQRGIDEGKKVAEKDRKRTAKWNELSDEEQKRNAIKFAEEYMKEVQPLDEPLRDTRIHHYNAKKKKEEI